MGKGDLDAFSANEASGQSSLNATLVPVFNISASGNNTGKTVVPEQRHVRVS